MNLNGAAPTITVAAQPTTDTITGVISGAGGFTKAGAGALTLTPTGPNTFTGPVTVSSGLLTLGNANALGPTTINRRLTVAATAELNINAFAASIGSLSGGGIVTNSGAAQTLTIGAGSTSTTRPSAASSPPPPRRTCSLTKIGTNNQILTGPSTYTGATTVTGGTLTLQNGSTSSARRHPRQHRHHRRPRRDARPDARPHAAHHRRQRRQHRSPPPPGPR